jgi:tripartite-type tricarboxylate transporter receptor subunit TctC
MAISMEVTRRRLLKYALSAGTLVLAAPYVARGAAYPTQRITIINQFPPGTLSDAAARLVAQSLQDQFGQPVIVENKVGGNGLVAAVAVARATPDGYTLLATASSLHSGAALLKELPIDLIRDFTHISRISKYPSFIAIRSDLAVNSIQELVAYAKANPRKLSYGHGNNTGQIVGEVFKLRTNIDVVRVPYRSNAQAMTDLVGGQIDLMVPDLYTGMPHVLSGKARALAVLDKIRSPVLPDTPTLDETVIPGFELVPWGGLSGPANLPPEVVSSLEHAVRATIQQPKARDQFQRSGVEISWAAHKEFTTYVSDQLANWTNLIKEAGIKPE